MPPINARLVVDAVLTALAGLGFEFGDGVAPQEPRSPLFPYGVVYSLDSIERDGPFNDRQADEISQIQVTTVGTTREQAQALGDLVRSTLLSLDPVRGGFPITGRSVQTIDLLEGGGVERDDEPQPPLFYGVDVYGIWSTPS